MTRHEARRCALQALFQIDVGKADITAAIHHVIAETADPLQANLGYIQQLVEGTETERAAIDNLLTSRSEGWGLDRMARVDLSVLRLAIYELLVERDVDVATIVDEAVELAKEFGSEASGRFVNGVLARIIPASGRPVASAQRQPCDSRGTEQP